MTVEPTPRPPRDFTYIRPRKRRLSEYEAVTCYVQPDPDVFDKEGWFVRTAEGRPAWRRESTRLVHPHWFDFRDPASQWQRTYVRMQAEQERAIERDAEDAKRDGAFAELDEGWLRWVLGGHYRVWSFVEYGLFRAFAPAQREALSDTLGNVLCFEAFDRMRHAQGIVLHLLDLEEVRAGFRDEGAKAAWLGEPRYQPLRELVERLVALDDWAELAVAVNLVFDPLVTETAVSQLVRRNAAAHGDTVTPTLIRTTERDRRRNLDWTLELVRMATAPDVPAAAENARAIRGWLDVWTQRAVDAAEALLPVWEEVPRPVLSPDEALDRARAARSEALDAAGIPCLGNERTTTLEGGPHGR